jgi:hypothetical protein|uniref:Uncharacterized protein n=1 Tax=Siphoviridae sp. ctM4P7 TaxID=2826256 RepID=A0A8S5MYA2_9CAUD|nr:MAG TPA: hypothetical protein [Siphoviridae sp. ctM4P7]
MNKTFYNASGCKDTTAGKAIEKVTKEEKLMSQKAKDTVSLCKHFIELKGFELIGTIKIRDRKTGREYR